MKKRNYTLILFVILSTLYTSFYLSAQQLPNSGFENWEYDALNQYEDGKRPVNWNASNVKKTVVGITAGANMVFPDGGAHSGTYCVKAINTEVGAAGVTETSPAWVTLGKPWSFIDGINTGSATAGTDGGITFAYRPDTIAVWIKRTSSGNENAHIVFYSWKGTSTGTSYRSKNGGCSSTTHYDEESDIRSATDGNDCVTSVKATQIAEAMWRSKEKFSNWTEIKIPIKYYTNDKPEKCNVIISAANYPNKRSSQVELNSTIWADDVRLIYSSAIHELYIGGIKLNGFKSDVLEYTKSLGEGATEIPEISAKRSGRELSGSEITIKEGVVDGEPTLITVRAEDGLSTTTYKVYFVTKQSDNYRLKDIKYNGESIPNFNGFNPGPYNIELPYGTTERPTIEIEKAEDKQTYEINYSSESLPCVVTIKSYAQDKNYTETYTVNFTIGKLSDNTLQNILVGGNAIAGFNPTKTNYVVELPQGTSSVPEITTTSAYPDGEQTITHVDNGLSGVYEVKVSVPGNPTERTYKLTFKIVASNNCNLQGIFIGGVPLEDFVSETTNYNYELPQGTEALPEITYTQGDAYQSIVTTSNGVEGKYSIKVTSQSGLTKIYNINFSVYKSDISTLNDIKIGGESIENFKSDSIDYIYELPIGTTELPEISWEKGEVNQSVTLLKGGVNGATTIRVIAENGTNVTTYQIIFSVQKSTDANLINIKVDGVALDGFRKDSLNYVYTLGTEATSSPTIQVETEFPKQRVEITRPLLEGTATIKVFSETGDSYNIYTIRFAFPQSDNNYLKNIAINGVNIAGFDKETTTYIVNLADEVQPSITYEKDDELQSVVLINNFANKNYSLVVTAENGNARIYNVDFNIALSGNALLKDIKLFDKRTETFISLPDFASDKFTYTDSLEWRTKVVPNIYPVVGQKGQVVTIYYGKINATTTLHVEAEDGSTQDYTIVFPVRKSDVTTLEYISLSEGELDFDKETLFYNVTLPYGTTKVPTIDFGKSEEEQQVVLISKNINDTTDIVVTAENGDKRTYRLAFNVAPSGKENVLTSIIVEGVGAFTSNAEVVIPYGTTEFPDITCVKNFPEQTVLIDNGGISALTTITVKANENGVADKIYTLTPKIGLPRTALSEIKVNGTAIAGYDPNKYTYVVNVNNPVGEQPMIEYPSLGDVIVEHVIENSKHVQLKVTDTNEPAHPTKTYDIYFYYPSDVIPNASFEEWSETVYNGAKKPTGWIVPADVADRYTYKLLGVTYGTYTSGEESAEVLASSVEKGNYTEGNYVARLKTTYHRWSLSGAMPGMMTLGDMSVSLTNSGSSTSSVGGGIPYRNTPDTVLMNYRPEAKKDINNMHFLYTLSDGTNSVSKEYSGGYTNLGSWVTMRLPIYDEQVFAPATLNLTINSANSENAKDLGGVTERTSTLYVDNLRFTHTSKLTSINVADASTEAGEVVARTENLSCTNGENMARASHIDQERYVTAISATTGSSNFTSSALQTSVIDAIYKDRRNETIVVQKGDNVSFNFASSNAWDGSWMYGYVYIDWNNDGDFSDSGELVSQSPLASTPSVASMPAVVIPTDAKVGTYTLRYKQDWESTDPCGAADIAANAGIIVDFELRVTDAGSGSVIASDYYLPAEYQGIPTVIAVGEVPDQEHTVQFAQETESGEYMVRRVTLNSKAEDGTSTNYSFNLNRLKSSNKQLKGIKINGVALEEFQPNTLSYNYTIANGTTCTPDIEAVRGSMHQSIRINTDGINSATIVVTAENGSATTYSINFVEEKSDVATLENIEIAGNPTDFIFDANTMTYNVALSAEASVPAVSFIKHSDGQTVTMTATIESIKLVVVAENGTNENTYTINFIREEIETDAKLKDIAIDNSTLPTFNSDIYEYNVEKNSEILLTYEKNFVADSLITTIYADSVIWQVENKTSEKNRYKLAFSKVVSSNAYLDGILTEKVLISGFEEDLFNYEIVSETIPEISIEKGDKNQSITTTFNEKQIVISVVAENGINGQMYTIDFISPQPKSDNALLGGIEIGGEPLADFVASEFNYNYTLPMHTDILPTISIISGGVGQDITITSNGIEGITDIVVVAEDGASSKTYSIDFSVKPCNNSSLSNIQIDGEPLTATSSNFECDKNFDANEQEYTLLFPNDRTTYPTIKPIPAHELCQSLTIDTIRISRTECDIKIKVVAENEVDSTIYLLHIIKKKSSNALLKMIYVDEEEIVGFDESTFGYVVNLPYGSTIIPNTTCEKQEDGQIITITPATTVNDVTTIEVIAENGTDKNTYFISYNILPSTIATLSGIFIGGELISTTANGFVSNEEFSSENYEYHVALPVGTIELPDIDWETTVPDITSATLETNGIESATITIVAQDGVGTETYTINFEVLKSDNNKLADLRVEGVTIGTKQNDPYEVYFGNYEVGNIASIFNPDSVVYTLVYPIGTDSSSIIKKEDIDFDRGENSQTVTISQTKSTEFLITVTAENGIPNYYVINVKILLSNNSLLKDIKVDGLSIETFDPTVFYYEYMLYQGDTIPSILPEKQEDSQIISVITKPVGEETLITCQAEDLSTSQYKILFKYSTENPGDAPTPDDVRWMALGGGRWKATSKRNNVRVYIFEPSGRMIDVGEVPIIGANDNLDSKDANGKIFRFARGGKVYIYCFVHEKKRLMSGKFLY